MAKKRKVKKNLIIFTAINVIMSIIFSIFVFMLNIVPAKYITIILIALVLINILLFFLIKSKKKGLKIFGYILSVIFIIIYGVGIYYLETTNNFLNKSFNNASNEYTNTYYVVTLNNNDYSSVEDVKDEKLGYYKSIPNIDKAIEKLNKKVETNNKEYEEMTTLLKDLNNKKVAGMIIESSLYDVLTEETKVITKKDYKVLYKFKVKLKEEKEEVVNDGNSFSIYLAGVDFTGTNTDLNMVITINKKTHKILLTSIPRDFYVSVSGLGMKELLGYAGYTGINTSRKTVADLFGVNIDYYVKVNTQSLVKLVDTLGGVNFCSNKSYTTTHALVMGTYDDTTGRKLRVTQGCKTYSGIEILTISRERKAFADGDRQRQRNCQDIMINIFKKMTSAENIANYSNVLNAVSDLYTTNIERDLVTELAKDTINNGSSWSFEQQSVTGRDSSGYVHLGTVKDYVMIPDQTSLDEATNKINKIVSGK